MTEEVRDMADGKSREKPGTAGAGGPESEWATWKEARDYSEQLSFILEVWNYCLLSC